MKENKFLKLGVFFLVGILLMSFVSASYSRASPQYVRPGNSFNYNYGANVDLNPQEKLGQDMCSAGQDFVLQIPLGGCEPAVVRSDMLEEQNYPVFCQIAATKINPLIDVNAIDYISFKGELPDGVSGIGFHPARYAIKAGSMGQNLNSPVLENIGYAVIVLEQNKNESSMPDYVEGSVTAHLRYDIENAFGIGRVNYYLPELNDIEWENHYEQYGFWQGRGFLRTQSVDDMGATISIYQDQFNKVATVHLEEGETSRQIQLPGFYCLAGLTLKLDDLSNPDTRAKLNIDGSVTEVGGNERFLDNQCQVRGEPQKEGLSEKVSISCRTDEGTKSFDLAISPSVDLDIEGQDAKPEGYQIGDILYPVYADGKPRNVFLGYIGENDKGFNYIIPVASTAVSKEEFINSGDYDLANIYGDFFKTTNNANLISAFKSAAIEYTIFGSAIVRGTDLGYPIQENEIAFEEFLFDSGGNVKAVIAGGGASVGAVAFALFTGPLVAVGVGLVAAAGLYATMRGYDISLNSIEKKRIHFKNLTSPGDVQFASKEFRENFENAIKDYKAVANNFPNVPVNSKIKKGEIGYKTSGEEALFQAISLARDTNQIAVMRELCEDFENTYSESISYKDTKCDDPFYTIGSSEATTQLVFINGEVKAIQFEGVSEPTFEEFGAIVSVRGAKGGNYDQSSIKLRKGQRVYLSEKEFFELDDIGEDYIRVKASLAQKGFMETYVTGQATNYQIELNKYQILGGNQNYEVKLHKINLKKQAKVSVIPKIENAGTEANFSFKIGIEKRAIQLSPKKTKDLIKKLDGQIKQWNEFSDNLGNVIKGFKGACLGIGAMLTIKNFFGSLDGTSIARQEAMQGENGWIRLCQTAVETGRLFGESVSYVTVDDCLNRNNENVEKDVGIIKGVMASQGGDERKVTEDNIRDGAVLEGIGSRLENNIDNFDENVKSALTAKGYKDGLVTMSQARDLDRLNEIANNPEVSQNIRNMSSAKRDSILKSISDNSLNYKAILDSQKRDKLEGLDGMLTNAYFDERRVIGNYNGFLMPKNGRGDIPENAQTTKVVIKKKVYYVTLVNQGILSDNLRIEDVYDLNGIKLDDAGAAEVKGRYTSFKKYDSSSYHNPMSSVDKKIRYFETVPYQGLPSVVPFDTANGWYVRSKQTLGISGNIRAYDDSGRVGSFYLCNVMKDKRIASDIGLGDDECMKFNPATGQVYGTFPGLTEAETGKQINCAIDAISSAEKASSKKGGTSIDLRYCGQRETIAVGNPSANVPEFQCQNFMSPKDCWILFNACDPVICPSSRCNFGGSYHVKDVVQSGIIGSIALCLPNIKEKIMVPICLTGIKAGLDGLISVMDSYKSCLQHSLDTGETVGVCDEIHSIYLCEFLWKQALPLFKLGVPKLLEFATGQGMRGGGEYLNVQSAWENADNSLNFFTQSYGANSFTAFKARSTEEVGTEVCKVSISARYPVSGIFFDNLLEPDSPAQFHGWFSEDTLTTATIPPTSQYHVYYHIFAGKDQGVSYRVYLSGSDEGGFYEDVGTINVASGFIGEGESADEKKDFTAPANYKQLCISVNNQVECGFGKVSTSFALNYAEDMYLESQASQKVTKTSECESGTQSAWGLLNPNLQEGVENTINPELYNHGVIRVCSTSSPGKATDYHTGTEDARWLDVGYCDNENVRCWLDKTSVEDSMKDLDLKNKAIKEAVKSHTDRLAASDNVIGQEEFDNKWKPEIESKIKGNSAVSLMTKESAINVINFITMDLISKILMNENKAWLYLTRASAYSALTRIEYKLVQDKPVDVRGNVVDNTLEKKSLWDRGKEIFGIGGKEYLTCSGKTQYSQGKDSAVLSAGLFPVKSDSLKCISWNFGDQRANGDRCHVGVDIYTQGEGNVVAIAKGKVVHIYEFYDKCKGGTAMAVIVDHGDYVANYGEITKGKVEVNLNDEINEGDLIGQATACGMLHFELYKKGVTQNIRWEPNEYVKAEPNYCRDNNLWNKKPPEIIDPTETLVTLAKLNGLFSAGDELGNEEVIQKALCFYFGEGLTKEGASYIVGNLIQESTLNPSAVGDGGLAKGLAQWHPDRWENLRKWAGENNLNENEFETQLKFTLNEKGQSENLVSALKTTSIIDIEAAIQDYEGYGDKGKRYVYGKEILNKINQRFYEFSEDGCQKVIDGVSNVGERKDENYVSPIFEFKDGGLNYNVFLVYTKDGWKWSFDRGQDKIWNSPPYKVPPKFIGDFMISDQVKLLIDNLNQKDYREGIKYIMNNLRFPKNFIDSLGGSQELCTENVCLEKDEGFLFVVRKGNIGTEFKYDSSSRKWVSKSGAGFSSLKNDIFVKGYFGDDNVFVEKVEEVNDLLKNTKDIYLGPMIIFSIDEKEGVNSYGVVKDETDGPFSTILSSALDRIDELLSSYGDVGYEANEEVAEFIDNLAREGILLEEEYNEITFESRKLKYVKSLLREKSLQN